MEKYRHKSGVEPKFTDGYESTDTYQYLVTTTIDVIL